MSRFLRYGNHYIRHSNILRWSVITSPKKSAIDIWIARAYLKEIDTSFSPLKISNKYVEFEFDQKSKAHNFIYHQINYGMTPDEYGDNN